MGEQAPDQRAQVQQLLHEQRVPARASLAQQGQRQLAEGCTAGTLQGVSQRPLLPVALAVVGCCLALLLPAGGSQHVQ